MAYKYELDEFRSGGFLNRHCNMGRVYIELPLAEAMRLVDKLNSHCLECDGTGEILLCGGSDSTGIIVDCEACGHKLDSDSVEG